MAAIPTPVWAKRLLGRAEAPTKIADPLAALIRPASEAGRQRLDDLLAETPVPSGRVARHLQIAGIDDFAFGKNAVLSLADINWPDSIRYGFVELGDAIVTPFGFVVSDDRLVFNTQLLPDGWMRGGEGGSPQLVRRIFARNSIHKLDIWRGACLLSLPADLETLDGLDFLFSSRLSCFNFAHLVHDTLIQAPTYLDACAYAGADATPLLVGPSFHFPIMEEVFRRAVGRAPMLLKDRFFRVRRLFVPTTHFSLANDAIARGAVARLVDKLSHALADHKTPAKRRLFISREDSGREADLEPRFVNAEELQEALGRLDVEPVVASRLGVEDYLRTFANAELIVGLHGAGLANAVLSASVRVAEITVPGYPDSLSLRLFIETGMGAPYRRIVMGPPENGLARYDVAAVVAACEALLSTPCPPVRVPL
jgi:hypothetical protein